MAKHCFNDQTWRMETMRDTDYATEIKTAEVNFH